VPIGRRDLIDELEASGLRGRGGAAFPVATKWRAVTDRLEPDARILVNGAEGEPLSAKDRTVMALRPHLVLDGAEMAAQAIGASEVVVYVGAAHMPAHAAINRALLERRRAGSRIRARIVAAPDAYVAGEETAAIHFVNDGDARPTAKPPLPHERGLGGRPTLVQNVETLATIALIGRYGADWYRSSGRGMTHGSCLVTLSDDQRMVVHEVELGTRIGELATLHGGQAPAAGAVLLGGYFGTWLQRDDAWGMPLDPQILRSRGLSPGAGVVSFLRGDQCGVVATAHMLDYMAGQSAAQCGPCAFGLRAIADALHAIASFSAAASHVALVERWSQQLIGRGACRHPDGAAGLVLSALSVFASDVDRHMRMRRCAATSRQMAA
jgi:NADH:ubiquinone oxidoreductase subunit F (NADH-binding)